MLFSSLWVHNVWLHVAFYKNLGSGYRTARGSVEQQSADSNIIQLHLILKCTKDETSHFCDCFLVSKWIFQHYDHCLTKFHTGSEQPLVCRH